MRRREERISERNNPVDNKRRGQKKQESSKNSGAVSHGEVLTGQSGGAILVRMT